MHNNLGRLHNPRIHRNRTLPMIIPCQVLLTATIGPGQARVVRVDLYPVFVLLVVVSAARHGAQRVAVGSVVGFVGAFARAAVAR
jgi:hypothetical protein